MLFQKFFVLLQLLSALSVEVLRLLTSPGATALLPPEGQDTAVLRVEDKTFELRLHVKRVS